MINELAFDLNGIGKDSKGFKDDMVYSMRDDLESWILNPGKTRMLYQKGKVSVWLSPSSDTASFLLTDGTPFPIGYLYVEKNNEKWMETNVSLILKDWQGKGYGMLLYELAYKHYGTLCSSNSLSGGSTRLWKALCTKYNGKIVIPKYASPTKKALLVDIVGWDKFKDSVVPLVKNKDGNVVSYAKISKTKDKVERRALDSYYFKI